MDFQESVKYLLTNGYTHEQLAVACMVTTVTIKNWAEEGRKPNKLIQQKIQGMAQKVKKQK